MISCRSISPRSCASRYGALRCTLPTTSSRSMISRFLSATAAATGWPPNVEPCRYMRSFAISASATRSVNIATPIGAYALVSPLAPVMMSGR